jgi:hypothetical protein
MQLHKHLRHLEVERKQLQLILQLWCSPLLK